MEHDVKVWLQRLGLHLYVQPLEAEGWETFEDFHNMELEDLERCIPMSGHRKRFQVALDKHQFANAGHHALRQVMKEQVVTEQADSTQTEKEDDVKSQTSEESYVSCVRGNSDDQCTVEPIGGAKKKTNSSRSASDKTDRKRYLKNEIRDEMRAQNISGQDISVSESPDGSGAPNTPCGILDLSSPYPMVLEDQFANVIAKQPTFPSATIMNAEQVTSYEKCTFIQDVERPKDNYTDLMGQVFDSYEEKDQIYVETSAFKELQDIVEANFYSVILGNKGEGTSAMAIHLALKYKRKGYECLQLHSAQDWKTFVNGNSFENDGKRQFIIIDDMFGDVCVIKAKVTEWTAIIELMLDVVNMRKGYLIVVCISKKHLFTDVRPDVKKFVLFQSTSIVDLTLEKYALSVEEKLNIWNAYATKYNVRTEHPDCIYKNKRTPHGFPDCVVKFCTNSFLQKDGIAFFDNPMEYVCDEIQHFIHHDRVKYFVLLLILFNNNQLDDYLLDKLQEGVDSTIVLQAAGLTSVPSVPDIRKALDSLRCMYVSEPKCGQYSISDVSVRENLALVYIKNNPPHAIKHIDFIYLVHHTSIHGSSSSRRKVALKPTCNRYLIQRMFDEIRKGNVINTCAHTAWGNALFVEEMIQYLLDTFGGCQGATRIETASIVDIFTTKDTTSPYTLKMNLPEALEFLGHRTAVERLSEIRQCLSKCTQGIMDISTRSQFFEPLSALLSNVMENVYTSTEVRESRIQSACTMEIIDNFYIQNLYDPPADLFCCIMGSAYEGCVGVESDVDNVYVSTKFDVAKDVSDVSADKTFCMLVVNDKSTKPGYAKLQLVRNGIPFYVTDTSEISEHLKIDRKGRVVVPSCTFDDRNWSERHGPAITQMPNTSTDIVTALRVPWWPDVASEWHIRHRKYHWPPQSIVEHSKSLGCLLVPVGHPSSSEQHLEWRFSYSHLERQLVKSFNSTQFQCYILLKLLKKEVIWNLIGHESLSSYHCKTCMFFLIEQAPSRIWKPENLLNCFQYCLKHLLEWTVNGYCPNYFMPEENLFQRHIHGLTQILLRDVLENVLENTWEYILNLKGGNIGHRLQLAQTQPCSINQTTNELVEKRLELFYTNMTYILLMRNQLLHRCCRNTPTACIHALYKVVCQLKKTKRITDYTEAQTKEALALLLPYIELGLVSGLVALAMHHPNTKPKVPDALSSPKWVELRDTSDNFSSRLKQATFLHTIAEYDRSLEILKTLENSGGLSVLSVCGCRQTLIKIPQDCVSKVNTRYLNESEFRKTGCAPCVAFLPIEQELLPVALAFEMIRSVEIESKNEAEHFWYNWAVVDSKVLLYFLLYLNHHQLGMLQEADSNCVAMEELLERDETLGHKETGYNLLGWMYRQAGKTDKSSRFFERSLESQPLHNAVIWHIQDSKQSF